MKSIQTKTIRDYLELVKRVQLINEEAGEYMKVEAEKLPEFCYSDSLSDCFLWYSTPQGVLYWSEISDKLDVILQG